MVDKKEKQIIVEQIMVTGYVKHSNGRKTKFEFYKNDFETKDLEGIFNRVGKIYQ